MAGARYEGYLEGFRVQFEEVGPETFDEYMGWDKWLYGGKNFKVLQISLTSGR